ncbi:hypothetical protein SAMN05421720_101283 [Rhodospira trueperi]|uniref:Uncharacterized protein n=1 Tax=Rhodospira trueperi TaxID=69960 RepID=A0A1G6WVG5_9PROT|nr:hypothetical protein SAMN05421720_101283 [Rhodospira trueperi]
MHHLPPVPAFDHITVVASSLETGAAIVTRTRS